MDVVTGCYADMHDGNISIRSPSCGNGSGKVAALQRGQGRESISYAHIPLALSDKRVAVDRRPSMRGFLSGNVSCLLRNLRATTV